MAKQENDYTPIACASYDELGLRMMRQTPTVLTLRHDDGTEQTVTATIRDIYSQNGAEYVRLDTDDSVRLDRIVAAHDAPGAS